MFLVLDFSNIQLDLGMVRGDELIQVTLIVD